MFILRSLIVLYGTVQLACGAAIPVWELLNKDEKMSYLYSLFANQVEDYCETTVTTTLLDCNRELLAYGLKTLKSLPEDRIDLIDPYQRGANTLIWESMLNGHQLMIAIRQKKQKPSTSTSSTPQPNAYDDPSFDEEFQLDGEASAKIVTVSKFRPNAFDNNDRGKPATSTIATERRGTDRRIVTSGQPEYKRIDEQRLFDVITFGDAERRPIIYKEAPLDGPMVVKVYPDGTPVDGASVNGAAIEDEDLKLYKLFKRRLPTV